jgi:hypothetical protein
MNKKLRQFIDAPRIQVVLVPTDHQKDRFELWLVLHVPDGKPPTTTRLGKDNYDRDGAIKAILDVYSNIGDRFGFEGTAEGSVSMQ